MRNIQAKLTTIIPVALLALLSILNSQLSTLYAQGTAFTYQGRLALLASGNPVTGSYDMTFAIFDHESGPAQVGATFPLAAVAVNNGLFTVTLDFGPGIFTGPPRWLEIAVRASGTADPYTTVPPRAAFTASPYAIMAGNAGSLGGQPPTAFAPASGSPAYVAKAGDTMTGSLTVSGYLAVEDQISGDGSFLTAGVYGHARSSGGLAGTGVWGENVGAGIGVKGTSNSGRGVYGTTAAAGPTIAGVYGENSAAGGTAVVGTALNINSAGVAGVADASGSTGVYGRGTTYGVFGTSSGQAGHFEGDVGITGKEFFGSTPRQMLNLYDNTTYAYGIGVQTDTLYQRGGPAFAWYWGGTHSDARLDAGGGLTLMTLQAGFEGSRLTVSGLTAQEVQAKDVYATDLHVSGSKNFKIDHPLDPANKYLVHSCVESPDVKNIYDGNVTTDEHGDAIVNLPSYFEALNRDFRYQLTAIGQFAQAIVSSKITGNQFAIKTDKPNVEVSWQVTGIRQDAYMKTHPIVVEQDKPANERGTYQHPELFGQPEEKGLSWSRNPEVWKQLKEERNRPRRSPKP